MGYEGGIVLKTCAGTYFCLAKNWHLMHFLMMSWVSASGVGKYKLDLKAFFPRVEAPAWFPQMPEWILLSRATPSLWEMHLHRVPEEAKCLNKSLPITM
jgi:hypothetical protein